MAKMIAKKPPLTIPCLRPVPYRVSGQGPIAHPLVLANPSVPLGVLAQAGDMDNEKPKQSIGHNSEMSAS